MIEDILLAKVPANPRWCGTTVPLDLGLRTSGVRVSPTEASLTCHQASRHATRRNTGVAVKKRIVAVDVDDVCADFISEWLRVYNYRYDDRLTTDDITGWSIAEQATKCTKEEFVAILDAPDFYEHVNPMPKARAAVWALGSAGHRVVYATACIPGTEEQKRKWLVKWGFLSPENMRRDFVPIQDKSLVRADFLFDDRIENVEGFTEVGGIGVLVRRPHNHRDAWRCGVQVRGMEDVVGLIEELTKVGL